MEPFIIKRPTICRYETCPHRERHSTKYPVCECGSAAIRGTVGLASPHEFRRVS
jgi:hypothetical protein